MRIMGQKMHNCTSLIARGQRLQSVPSTTSALQREAKPITVRPSIQLGTSQSYKSHRIGPPAPCPTNNFVLKKFGPNGCVRWTRRSVHTTTL